VYTRQPLDIDVNVSPLTVAQLKEQWPFDGLVDEKPYTVGEDYETILVRNEVGYPEEEKHSDFVIDLDYVERELDEVTTAKTAEPEAGDPPSAPRTTKKTDRLPASAGLSPAAPCGGDLSELESDDLARC